MASGSEIWNDGTDGVWGNSPWELLPGVRTGAELSLGERSADWVRNKMGSWGFVFSFTVAMIIWAFTNSYALGEWFHHKAFDPYPYILLNLLLSTLAGLQGAILLIAAKRADAISAEQALSHLTISKSSGEIIREIKEEVRTIRNMSHELHQLLIIERNEHGD
jgi:uncharacterized membrane protein